MTNPIKFHDDTAGSALSRRDFMRAAAIAGAAAGLSGAASSAARAQSAPAGTSPGAASGDLVVKGGHVLSMDEAVGDFSVGDVHVRDGRIVAVGENIEVAGATIIDASDRIVMPGFVDAHSHLWNAFLRGSVRGDDKVRGYFPTTNRAAPHCTPDDAYVSARFGAMEELLSGVTTIHNFSHNTRTPEHADAEIKATLDIGLRTRFSYGAAGRGERLDQGNVEKTVSQWSDADPRVHLGVNLQPPGGDFLKAGTDDPAFLADVKFAKDKGLPFAIHYDKSASGMVAMLERNKMLGPDMLMVHPQSFTEEERALLVERKVNICAAPAIEIPYSTVRNGQTQFDEFEKLGAIFSISTDATSAIANGDFFQVMRALQWGQRQRTDADRALPVKRYLEIATIGGAQALGMHDEIGSLTPGKWADVITVRKSDINMAPVIDPYNSLVFSGATHNIDTVIVGGKVLVSGGRHQSVDAAEIVSKAKEAGLSMHEKLEKIIAEGQENADQMNRKG